MATVATQSSSSAALSEPELRAWRGLLRVHASLTKAMDAELEAEHGLPLTSYEVLMYLADAEGERMRMCDLASSIILSRSGLTRLVDRLERERLIDRVSCASDARGAFAKLTPLGREKLQAARATHLAGIRQLFLDRLTPEEQDQLGDLWERMVPGAASSCAGDGPSCG